MGPRVALAALAAAVTSILFIDFCDLMYSCGCRSLWAGADALCNIHDAHAVRHCPWCKIGISGAAGVWAAIVGTQALLALRLGGGWLLRVVATFAAFPVVGGLIAFALGRAYGYWG